MFSIRMQVGNRAMSRQVNTLKFMMVVSRIEYVVYIKVHVAEFVKSED